MSDHSMDSTPDNTDQLLLRCVNAGQEQKTAIPVAPQDNAVFLLFLNAVRFALFNWHIQISLKDNLHLSWALRVNLLHDY